MVRGGLASRVLRFLICLSSRARLVGLAGPLSLCFPLGGEGQEDADSDFLFANFSQRNRQIPRFSDDL